MFNQFISFFRHHEINLHHDHILVAVSGGIDSMVLAHLFLHLKAKVGLAHCNFKLRAGESDLDEQFVREFAEENEIPFYTRHFNTIVYASENQISTQMAARELRYAFFEEIRQANEFNWVAVAHQADDLVETFHINLVRGSGIRGLSGIPEINQKIIRPLLKISRKELEAYALTNKISFREDSSNLKNDYQRNYLRNEIIPKIETLNPGYTETMLNTVSNLRDVAEISEAFLESHKDKLLIVKGDGKIILQIDELDHLSGKGYILHAILSDYGFSSPQIRDIADALHSESGKTFPGSSHTVFKDRSTLIIQPNQPPSKGEYFINTGTCEITEPINLVFQITLSSNYTISPDKNIAGLDMSRLKFPLKIRPWYPGDYFYPIGMKNKKKLSDFFIDQRISIPDKQNTWVLESEGDIVWLIGYRIDDRFKITGETKEVLSVVFKMS